MPKVVLHQFPAVPGVPSMSPFCTKVHLALRVKRIVYETRDTLFPKKLIWNAQLPYVTWDGEGLTDSSAILRFLEQKVPAPALFPADRRLAAEAHVLEDWSDESLYWYACYAKFVHEEGWAKLRPHFAAALPAAMRLLAPTVARRRMIEKLRAQGVMRRTPEMILSEFDRHLDALETRLGGRGYLVGEAISAADLSVFAMLGQLTGPLASDFGVHIAARPWLSAYLERIRTETLPAA